MTHCLTKASLFPVGSIEAYIQQAYQVPLLSLEEEQELARHYLKTGDVDAARKLVFAHVRFVISIARKYQSFGLPLADLIQEGTVGLMKAVKRFNPDMGVRLVSFAIHWVKSEIHEYVLKNWRIVKIATTKAQRKLFFNLHKFSKQLKYFTTDEVTTIAEFLNVSEREVKTMEQRLSYFNDASLDTPAIEHAEPDHTFQHQALEDHRFNPAEQVAEVDALMRRDASLYHALEQLDERSRAILQQRWLNEDKISLQKLAEHYGVSIARIGQIEKQAMNKVRHMLTQQLLAEQPTG